MVIRMLAEIVLASIIRVNATNLQTQEFYNPMPNVIISTNCPTPEQAKLLLPKYGLENAVAEFGSYSSLKGEQGSDRILASTQYKIRAYNSKSNHGKITKLKAKEVEKFLQSDKFDIIELYEMNTLHQFHSKPSAIIYIEEKNKTYVIFDLEGQHGLADDKFDYVACTRDWYPKLVLLTGDTILMKRVIDTIIRKEAKPRQF